MAPKATGEIAAKHGERPTAEERAARKRKAIEEMVAQTAAAVVKQTSSKASYVVPPAETQRELRL